MAGKTLSKKPDQQHWKLPSSLIISLTAILSLLGLFFIFEASSLESFRLVGHQYYFLKQQTISLALGVSVFLGTLLLPSTLWKKTASWWFLVGLILLVLVLIPGFGVELNGARRWFVVWDRVFQPVEFFKLSLILFYAQCLTGEIKLSAFLFLMALFSTLILLQPDMGSLLILLWISLGLYFLAGGKVLVLGALSALGGLLLFLLVIVSPYRSDRLLTYFNPSLDPLGSGFHIRQITLALANGGWFGVGIGNSQQKNAYIPEASSDSIFAIIAEEMGFVGSLVIIGLLLALIINLYRIAVSLPEKSFDQLFVFGVFLWIGGQTLLNLAAVVALVPLTGLPLPFFSSGGSSLLTILFALGLTIRIYQEGQRSHSPAVRRKVQ
ncbi:MAG: FtsW/RodA/SpoVE family cell cycle protein [Candidatus Paceibacterota bacterium]